MSEGQAGVTALLHGDQVREMSELAKSKSFLSGKFQYDYWDNFAAGLNTLLATAPPEQAISERLETQFVDVAPAAGNKALTITPEPKCWHKEIDDEGICKACGAKAAIKLEGLSVPSVPGRSAVGMHQDGLRASQSADPPQAASAVALSTEQVREALNSADSQEWETPEEWAQHVADRLNAALAAHDQKVGDQLAAWMIVNSFATGHGDTVEDLLKELKWQIDELKQQVGRVSMVELMEHDQKVRDDALEYAAQIADEHWPESGHIHKEDAVSCQMSISVAIRRAKSIKKWEATEHERQVIQKVRAEVLLDASRLISGSCKDDGSETDEALTWAASRIRLLAETGK